MPRLLAAGYVNVGSQFQFERYYHDRNHRRINDPDALPRQRLQHRNSEGWPKPQPPGSGEDHMGARKRNFLLRARGLLPIVCPITDGSELAGIGIFNADVEEAKSIMDQDPAVKEGIFVYEAHPCRSFPGDCLPEEESADEKGHKGKGGTGLSKYFGQLKDDQILDQIEADAKRIRGSARSRV